MGMERTLHLYAESAGPLADVLGRQSDLSPEKVAELLELGAVFCDGKRLTQSQVLRGGEYLRVHKEPRRFPAAQKVDWASRIVAVEENFLVIDKPAGVPMHATLDNEPETVLGQLSRVRNERLFVTQRLDRPTEGLCIVARRKDFQRQFNDQLAQGHVKKTYRALTDKPVPVGVHIAFMEIAERAPKKIFFDDAPNRKRCELEVLSSEAISDGWENTIAPRTGRTHQIRAQLSLLGAPIRLDTTYSGEEDEGGGPDRIALQSCILAFTSGEARHWAIPRPAEWTT